jgi:predicted adenylyl cyclase CyaB
LQVRKRHTDVGMPANVEIKARVEDLDQLRAYLERTTGTKGELLVQEDVFFKVPHGRLKLRIFDAQRGELIAYSRADETGPRLSEYTIAPTSNPAALCEILAHILGVLGAVRKRRLLFRLGATRVHLDRVEGLGDFVELEVVLEPGQRAAEGVQRARQLMVELTINESALVPQAYIDLIARENRQVSLGGA